MGEVVQLGAQMKKLSVLESDQDVVAVYELIDPKGVILGGSGSIRISFAALEAIDKHLGGTGKLTGEQRIDLAAKFIRPLIVGTFERVAPPAETPERKDAIVNAVGAVVKVKSVPVPGGA